MSDPVDTSAPWTIKSISTRTREAVTVAARREGLTVGQWLERRVAEWEGQGSPINVGHTGSNDGSDLGKLAAAFRELAAAGLPIPKTHAAKLTGALLNAAGLPVHQPDATKLTAARLARLPAPAEPPKGSKRKA